VSRRPSPAEIDAALETLARALAPHIAPLVKELLDGSVTPPNSAPASGVELEALVGNLSPDVAADSLFLLEALQSERREIDSITLADRAGVSTREVSARIIRPLQGVVDALRLGDPWTATRAAPSGGLGARTVWRSADHDTVRLLYEALKRTSPSVPTSTAKQDLSPRRVLPSAVFPYSPEYARGAEEEGEGWSSCLRDSEPGSRAVIYRVHSEQGVVALFDIEKWPKQDREWGYGTDGYFAPIKPAISRAKLLADPVLEPVFRHIQGRRRLPAGAQAALAELIEKETGERLPDHSLTRRSKTSKKTR
jgi:hypothetical protein